MNQMRWLVYCYALDFTTAQPNAFTYWHEDATNCQQWLPGNCFIMCIPTMFQPNRQ